MKTWLIMALGVAATVALASTALSLPSDRAVAVTARVLDLNNSGERRVMISMHNEPFLLQYGAQSYGTTEFCVVPENPKAPRTCYRAKEFNSGSSDSQRLKFVWQDPFIYQN